MSHAVGRVDKTFIGLPSPISERAGAGGHPCQGLLHQRAGDSSPTVAVIATHYNVDFSEHYLAPLLAERGVAFLGWNTRYRGDEIHFLLDHALVEIGVGVSFLRQQGFDKIVLLGNSGGASLMSAYQSQAVEPNVEPVAGMHPARGLDTLLPADGYISLAAHPGRPDCLTARLDAALIDETDPAGIDSELDLWNPENGPPYSDEFLARYRTAQLARNNRITQWAKSELSRLKSAGVSDRVFAVSRSWADPRMIDPTIEPSDRRPNSSIGGDPRRANSSVWGLGVASTLRSWLSMWSMETSQCRAEPHLARVTVPSLVVHTTADPGVYRSDASRIYEAIGSTDKTYVEVNGDHYLLEPEGTRDKVADIVTEWITSRFGSR